MKFRYMLFLLSLTSCDSDSPQYFNIEANVDTTINVKRKSSYTTQMRIIVTGEIEDDCMIILKEGKLPDNKVSKRTIILEKGIVNDTLGSPDIYADWGDIIFKHQNNSKGQLKLEVYF